MPRDAGGEFNIIDNEAISKLEANLANFDTLQEEAEKSLHAQRISNLQELYNLKVELVGKAAKQENKIETDAKKDYLKQYAKVIEAEEKKAQKKGKTLSAAEKKAIEEKYKYEGKVREKYEKAARKRQAEEDRKATEKLIKDQAAIIFSKGQSLSSRLNAFTSIASGPNGKINAGTTGLLAMKALSSLSQQLNSRIEGIAKSKASIDTRLQGSNQSKNWAGSYWDVMNKQLTGIAGLSPLLMQEDIAQNLKGMVGRGISYNVTQRAVLNTIKDKIATTFDATNNTLLRLVRIQQQDTTAGRLGMEAALNTFLNQMFETTEYMSDIMTGVKASLEESMSLMGAGAAVGFEYQVQKWMGSLYSVGMSGGSVQNIASTLGKLASGDLDALSGGGLSNLFVMAAGNANKSIGSILANGLDESSTNELLEHVVDYLAGIYHETSGNLLLQQQMAKIYGVSASDLKAAANLSSSMRGISNSHAGYGESTSWLLNNADRLMYSRTSAGEMLTNMWGNSQYSLAAGIANNPALYGIYKMSGLLNDTVGGINIPTIGVMGNMVDMEASVADIMAATAMGGGMLSMLGSLISGGGGFSIAGSLKKLGIDSPLNVSSRGVRGMSGGIGISESGLANSVGNASGTDIKNAALQGAADEANAKRIEAKENDENSITLSVVDNHILNIHDLLQSVISGNASIAVRPTLAAGNGWN